MFVHLRQGQCRPALPVSGFDVFPSGLVPVVGLAVRFLHVDVASQAFLEVQ